VQNVENGIEFSFTLPSGVYATCLMRELLKNQ
jgi:tRNA(Glu) U13 pseudouridine synthase TruD